MIIQALFYYVPLSTRQELCLHFAPFTKETFYPRRATTALYPPSPQASTHSCVSFFAALRRLPSLACLLPESKPMSIPFCCYSSHCSPALRQEPSSQEPLPQSLLQAAALFSSQSKSHRPHPT